MMTRTSYRHATRQKESQRRGSEPRIPTCTQRREGHINTKVVLYLLYLYTGSVAVAIVRQLPDITLRARWRWWEDKRAIANRAPAVLDPVIGMYQASDACRVLVAPASLFCRGPD